MIERAALQGEVSRILKILADILASGASYRAWNGLIFRKSAPFMHFGAHKNFRLPQITLSISLLMIIIILMIIEWSHWTEFFCDHQYIHNWRTLTKYQPIQVHYAPHLTAHLALICRASCYYLSFRGQRLQAQRSFRSWGSSHDPFSCTDTTPLTATLWW